LRLPDKVKEMKLANKIVWGTLGLWLLVMAAVTIGKTLWPGYPWETLTATPKIGDIF